MIAVDTKAGYLIDTANYSDFVILNGGVRYDDYNIRSAATARTTRIDGQQATALRHVQLECSASW